MTPQPQSVNQERQQMVVNSFAGALHNVRTAITHLISARPYAPAVQLGVQGCIDDLDGVEKRLREQYMTIATEDASNG